MMRIKKQVKLRILTIDCHSILAEIVGSDAEEINLFRKIITDDCCCRSLNHNSLFRITKLYALRGKLRFHFLYDFLDLTHFLYAGDHRIHNCDLAKCTGTE